jgi:uncharacterized protein (TIGR03437 family)
MMTWNAHKAIHGAVLLAALSIASSAYSAQPVSNRYALILQDSPVSARFASREAIHTTGAMDYRQQIEARQRTLRTELASRKVQVTGSVSTLLNAIFVVAPASRVAELKGLPGVQDVVPIRRYKLKLNRATQLVNAPAAWNALNGVQNAGAGIKIAILDTGIDQTHPAFQDASLPMPSGYPICSGSDCDFTSNKVIVARSYVRQLAAGSDPANPAADSRPDDYSPRDRAGHGTAVASIAAGVTNTGLVTITGMAPKAYLGNYKIYGSPEVNATTADDVIIQALDDAINDGMDVISFSSGGPAFFGPLDSGAVCGNSPGVPCDLSAAAFENAAKAGMIIVAAAGNDGADGNYYPTFNSIASPGDAPSVISVGATTNSHVFYETVALSGSSVPSNLQTIEGYLGTFPDYYYPIGAVTSPLWDVTQLGNDGLACSALPAGSLNGAFALIKRGSCSFDTKLINAENAGAVGAIFYMADSSSLVTPSFQLAMDVPAIMISNADGVALKSFIDANPGFLATIDPSGEEFDSTSYANELAYFSSFGPSTGDSAVKPDLVAVGSSIYMAAESYDPLGDLYSSTRYASAGGTSFATPLVAGAAALVKQAHPTFTAAQVKSALVNTASQDVLIENAYGFAVDVQWLGAGKLDAGAAVNTAVTITPATISFGVVKSGSLPATRQLQVTNNLSGPVTLTVAIAPNSSIPGAALSLGQASLSLAAGATGTVSVTLSGSVPPAGEYSGAVTIQGPGVSLRVPYLFLVGEGTSLNANITPLIGDYFDGTVNQGIPDGIMAFKLTDYYGAPISGAAVLWTARNGATLQGSDTTTDAYGIAATLPILGSQPGAYSVTAAAGGLSHTFTGTARSQPTVPSNGIVDSASFSPAIAPGSYISIFGTGLSDTTDGEHTAILPLAIDYVNVSFDVPSAGISVPGHLTYVSPTQVNVQVPWELHGQTSAQVKVTIDYSNGNVVTVPISDYAPAFFQGGNGLLAAQDSGFKTITASNPALHGQMIVLYANGLGPVTNQPKSGEPAPLSPLAETTTPPVVTIGGQAASVLFSGLTPSLPGLYQLNVVVPSGLSPGIYPVTVLIGGQTSKPVNIPVQ